MRKRGALFWGSCLTSVAASLSAPGAAAQDNGANALMEEIVVTARKRQESVQDVPIAITAFTAATLDARGITQIDQIANFTPNLTYQNNPGFGGGTNVAAIYIRGIGQFDFLGSIEPGVGLYVDGVYVARSVGAIMDLVDVERVEVLRGPQGTLFGRNTIGGAVSITSKKPSEDFEGNASFLFGDDMRLEGRASLNGALTDTLYARISASYMNRDGYVFRLNDNGPNGNDLGNKDTAVGRLQLRWQPSSAFTADLSVDYTRDRSNGAPYVFRGARPGSNFFNPNRRPLLPPAPPLSPFTLNGGGVSAGNGFEGTVNLDALPPGVMLPPGVDPNTIFYQLNVQQQPFTVGPGRDPIPGTFEGPLDPPVDNFQVLWNYLQAYGPGGTPGVCMSAPFQPYFDQSTASGCYGPQFFEQSIGQFNNASGFQSYSDSDIWGASLDLNYDFGPVQVRSITAYREIDAVFAGDQDGTPLPIAGLFDDFQQQQISQELQFLGESFDGRLNWIAGFYYFDEDVDNNNNIFFTPVEARSGGLIENRSLAVFAQGTFDITEKLSVTAGLRWTKDDKTFDIGPWHFITQSFVGPGLVGGFDACPNAQTFQECAADPTADSDGIPNNGPLIIFETGVSEQNARELNPYLNLSYDWSRDIMTYVSYSQGFKSGGFTQRVFPPLPEIPSVGPETVEVYEAGFKSALADGAVRVNGAVFYSDYDDIQVQGFTLATGAAPVYFNLASGAEIYGFEIDFAASLPDGWFIEGAGGYTNASYNEDGFPEGAILGVTADSEFERVSKWVVSAAVQKEIEAQGLGTFTPRLDWAYRSKFFNDASNVEGIAQPGYSVFNATLSWKSEDGRFDVLSGVNNIFRKRYIHSAIWNNTTPSFQVLPNRGREWYVRAGVNF